MRDTDHLWVILLAGGEGNRLKPLTIDRNGFSTPKQYCRFYTDRSLFGMAADRAESLVPKERIVPVVAEHHRPWWGEELADFPRNNILVQSLNRETGPGILLPLTWILTRDPQARVVVLPSDHYFQKEETIDSALRRAVRSLSHAGSAAILLGMQADRPETGYGWITHHRRPKWGLFDVDSFVEKPDPVRARRLMEQGALWNSFLFAAEGKHLLRLFQNTVPELVNTFHTAFRGRTDTYHPWVIRALYEIIPTCNFSHEVLQEVPEQLRVLPVPQCGWSDLGTPDRVFEHLSRKERELLPARTQDAPQPPQPRVPLAGKAAFPG